MPTRCGSTCHSGVIPQQRDRRPGVVQRNVVMSVRHPVTEHQRRDPALVHPLGDLNALMGVGYAQVSPSRTDDDGLARCLGRIGPKQHVVGLGDLLRMAFGINGLVCGQSVVVRRALRVERLRFGNLSCRRKNPEQGAGEQR